MPEYLKDNEEFFQVCNTLSVHKRSIKGVYYFYISSVDDLHEYSMTFEHMGIENVFAEPDINPILENKKEVLN